MMWSLALCDFRYPQKHVFGVILTTKTNLNGKSDSGIWICPKQLFSEPWVTTHYHWNFMPGLFDGLEARNDMPGIPSARRQNILRRNSSPAKKTVSEFLAKTVHWAVQSNSESIERAILMKWISTFPQNLSKILFMDSTEVCTEHFLY